MFSIGDRLIAVHDSSSRLKIGSEYEFIEIVPKEKESDLSGAMKVILIQDDVQTGVPISKVYGDCFQRRSNLKKVYETAIDVNGNVVKTVYHVDSIDYQFHCGPEPGHLLEERPKVHGRYSVRRGEDLEKIRYGYGDEFVAYFLSEIENNDALLKEMKMKVLERADYELLRWTRLKDGLVKS